MSTAAEEDRRKALGLVAVSRETERRLELYAALLRSWQARINLVSSSTLETVWSRHFVDSLQLASIAGPWRHWVDFGSGAGFPGLVVALAAEAEQEVVLVESNYKRCAFLREVARETGARVRVIARKLEDAYPELPGKPDIVSARAVAPLPQLLAMAYPLLKTGAKGVFPKGQDVERELTEAAKCWRFNYTLTPSATDSAAHIVSVSDLAPLATS